MKKLLIIPIILSLSIYACGGEGDKEKEIAPAEPVKKAREQHPTQAPKPKVPAPTSTDKIPAPEPKVPANISGDKTLAPHPFPAHPPITVVSGARTPITGDIHKFNVSGVNFDVPEKPKALKNCTPCHTFDLGGKKKVGPNLFGIYGREAGKFVDFKYTEAFLKAFQGKVWDENSLDPWIENSKGVVKNTKMGVKVPKAEDRATIIGYLKGLK